MFKLFTRIFLLVILFFVSCKTKNNIIKNTLFEYKKAFASEDFWHFKDIMEDSVPGISLEKAYKELLKGKKANTIVVAVIDTELDIDHKDLKNQIWTNIKEIPNNNIDDDNNGYIDDIHGWNYVGSLERDSVPYGFYEYVRIINRYDSIYKDVIHLKDVKESQRESLRIYRKAYEAYHLKLKLTEANIKRYEAAKERYREAMKVTAKYISDIDNKSQSQLDSLKNTVSNYDHKEEIKRFGNFKKYGISENWIDNKIKFQQDIINYKLNFDFKERYLINDDSNDLNNFPYGNNNVQGTYAISHATEVASVISTTYNHTLAKGINGKVKIMPLSISVSASEHDKDIALAIRYAVDNGAKVINMSIGKSFSLHPKWVYDALKYAEKHDVLVVTSSGNDGYDLDKVNDYPNDATNGKEFIENFIKVGNTSYRVDSMFVYSSSNYGKTEVDIFAPGTKITCVNRWRKISDTGTSMSSAVVSGIASLIFSYYPNLSAAEVKQIILESGMSYDLMVLKPYANGEERDPIKVPFSSLSKSGKIVNAYNALLMAEEVSKKKKKRKK